MIAEQMARLYQKRIAELEPRLRKTMDAVGVAALRLSKEIMTREIYSIPEDLTTKGEKRFQRFLTTRQPGQVFRPKKGDRKWVRTGHLRRSERPEVRGPTLNMELAIVNDAIYAADRHERGKASSDIPGFKNPPKKINPIRECHWRDDMFRVMQPIFQEQMIETVREVMREGSHG